MIKTNKSPWKTYKFGDIASNISERAEPKKTNLDIYVGLEHLDPDCIHIKRRGHPSDVKGTKLRVYPGDIIFGKRRAYQRKAAIVDFDGICSAHAMVVRANTEIILPELLPHFMHSDAFMHRAVDISEGSLSPTIKWKILAEQRFKLPLLDEQKRIADLLWSIDKTKERFLSVSDALSSLIKSMANEFFNADKKSEFMNFGDCIDLKGGTQPSKSNFKYEPSRDHVRLLQIRDFESDDKAVYVSNKFNLSLCSEDDVLIARYGASLGKICTGKTGAYNVALTKIVVDEKQISKKYIYYFLCSEYFQSYLRSIGNRSAQAGFNKEDLSRLPVPIPPLDQQNRIIRHFVKVETLKKEVGNYFQKTLSIQKQIINQIFG